MRREGDGPRVRFRARRARGILARSPVWSASAQFISSALSRTKGFRRRLRSAQSLEEWRAPGALFDLCEFVVVERRHEDHCVADTGGCRKLARTCSTE